MRALGVANQPLIYRPYHEDQLCVVVGVHFKRSSTAQLIYPKLLQRFAALPLPKTIKTSHSKFRTYCFETIAATCENPER